MADSLNAFSPGGSEEENAGPAMEYTLPPLLHVLGELQEWADRDPGRSVQTTVYIWGYGRPESVLCREQCEATAAARTFARQAGWQEMAAAAWAVQITLRLSVAEAKRVLSPIFEQDGAVVGWGLQIIAQRPPSP
jgi:hypothetical protein